MDNIKQQHIDFIINKQHVTCVLCNTIFFDSRNLLRHWAVKHYEQAADFTRIYSKCQVCYVQFESVLKCNNHYRKHISDRHCQKCPFIGENKGQLQIHQYRVHPRTQSKRIRNFQMKCQNPDTRSVDTRSVGTQTEESAIPIPELPSLDEILNDYPFL
jgi:hypothetical protein